VVNENEVMTGIQFVMDDKGCKTAVLIDLKKHHAFWEDFVGRHGVGVTPQGERDPPREIPG